MALLPPTNPAENDQLCLTVCSFNMHGFNNSSFYLKDLCLVNDIIFVQEHWLLSDQLTKFDAISKEFNFFGVSAMDDICAQGILRGRPFGGVGVLVRKTYSKFISLIGFHYDNRVVAIKLVYGDIRIILVGVYFPYDRNSPNYSAGVCSITGFIESVLTDNPGFNVIVAGDFNFACNAGDKGYSIFQQFADELELEVCDHLNSASTDYTYFHETLGQKSFIDHFFVHKELHNIVSDFKIINDGANLSDHLPISITLILPALKNADKNNSVKHVIHEFRWDKGDLDSYYMLTGRMFQSIAHDFPCLLHDTNCDNNNCCLDIDIYYNEIVHCLVNTANSCIPKIPASALKHYWSDALNELKK